MSELSRPAGGIRTAAVALALTVAATELIFRLSGHDFEPWREEAVEAWPIFYQMPRVPVGDGFFRREGPASWSGQVLRTGYVLNGGRSDAYANEEPVTASYDAEGFRNAADLVDWEVAVVGDSQVELGHLPSEAIFTAELAQILGLRVKNIGASHTGPPAYVAYLDMFGAAPSARHAVMTFFEGNDIFDLVRESDALRRFEATGKREYRSLEPQSSFVLAAYRLARRLRSKTEPTEPDALFRERAVSLGYTPPDSADLAADVRAALDSTLAAWAKTAAKHRMTPWLAYLPCKRRVLHGHVRYTDPAADDWRAGGLPAFVSERAERYGVAFVDLTPALQGETAAGRMTYNGVWDTHLNRHGAAVVARTLAAALDP